MTPAHPPVAAPEDAGGTGQPPVLTLCRCFPCCCDPGQGHNDPRWIAYEKALDELEEAYRGFAS